jgi:hypothetical protein
MMRLSLTKLLLTKRLKLKLKRPQKQLRRPERTLLLETLLNIRKRCKSRELPLRKSSEMFGIQVKPVFLISNSLCLTTNKLLSFFLRSLRKLLQLM